MKRVSHFWIQKYKTIIVFMFFVIALITFVIVAWKTTRICQSWMGLIIGILLMILAMPFHILGKNHNIGYWISFTLNSIGNGFSVSAYYLSRNIELQMMEMLEAIIPAVVILLVACILLQNLAKIKKTIIILAALICILMLGASLILWIQEGNVLYSFRFFSLLIALFNMGILAVTINHDERSVLKDISFGSFGSFIIVTFVVIFILSEGDIMDGIDFLDMFDGSGTRKQKKNVQTP